MISGGLYDRMKLRGVDMSWYERGSSANRAVPVEDGECSKASVYLMKQDGTVWTLSLTERSVGTGDERVSTFGAQAHRQVRETGRELGQATYMCMHTKVAYADLNDAVKHVKCISNEGGDR